MAALSTGAPAPVAQMQPGQAPAFNVGGAPEVTTQPQTPEAVANPQAVQQEAQLPQQLAQAAQPVPQQPMPQQPAMSQAQAGEVPNIGQMPQPGPATQLAGPMVQGAVPNAPSMTPQPNQVPEWHAQLADKANDFNGLTTLIAQPGTPDDVKSEAKDRLWNLMQDEKLKAEAARKISAADSGNPRAINDLAREMSSNKKEGSYVKAILFARLGLTQLAQDEQQKLGAGTKYTSYMDANGDHFTVKLNGEGAVERAFDQTGKAVDENQLANLNANFLSMKGAATGQTMGFDKSGNVISHTVIPGTGRVIWKDETTGKILAGAPEGYHQGKNQQEMLANSAYSQSRNADENANRKAIAAGLAPTFSEDQIEQRASSRRNSILGLSTTTYGGAGEVPPGAAPAPAGGAGGGAQSAAQWAAANGIPVSAHGGDRTTQDQANQLAQWYAGGMQGPRPAEPGRSAHETGNAIDVPSQGRTEENRRKLEAAGFRNTVPGEPWHFERTQTSSAGVGAPTIQEVQRRNAEAISNYEQPPLRGGGVNSQNATIMAMVRQMNPNYDASKYDSMAKARKDFTTGKQGDTVRSMNVAIDHLDTMQEAANALKNYDTRVFNRVANEFSRANGEPAITNFEGVRSIVGAEVAKAISGGATALGDREEIRNEINAANSPEQLAGLIKKYQALLGGQLKGLRTQATDAGLKDFDNKLNSRTKKVLSGEESKNTRSAW